MSLRNLLSSTCLFLLLATAACNDATTPPASSRTADTPLPSPPETPSPGVILSRLHTDSSIVPGERTGPIVLNSESDAATKALGEPDRSESAMGKSWLTWEGKKEGQSARWDVYTAYRDTGLTAKSVQLIRTEDPILCTKQGIGVNTPLDSIGKAYPSLKYVGHYRQSGSGDLMSLYDAPGQGLAFEIMVVGNKKRCSAVIVHGAPNTLMSIYQPFLNINNWQPANEAP